MVVRVAVVMEGAAKAKEEVAMVPVGVARAEVPLAKEVELTGMAEKEAAGMAMEGTAGETPVVVVKALAGVVEVEMAQERRAVVARVVAVMEEVVRALAKQGAAPTAMVATVGTMVEAMLAREGEAKEGVKKVRAVGAMATVALAPAELVTAMEDEAGVVMARV